ncbi:MAG: transcription-repair coupling factor [Alphaproteobacteria bacterium]|nr:MAG: transcription-repair coupling factor [Alphaproteobacteria bacterium]
MNVYELSKCKNRTVFVTDQDVFALKKQLEALTDKKVFLLPGFNVLPYDKISPTKKVTIERVKTLSQLEKADIILANPQGLLWRIPDVDINSPLKIKKDDALSRELVVEYLQENLYERVDLVRNAGEYSVRGGVIDIFESVPLRLDFFGDQIESIKTFDILSQRTVHTLEEVEIFPAHELAKLPKKVLHAEESFYSELVNKMEEGIYIGGFEFYWPMFVEKSSKLFEKVKADFMVEADLFQLLGQVASFYQKYKEVKDIVKPEALYWSKQEVEDFLKTAKTVSADQKDIESFKSIDAFKEYVKTSTKPIVIGCDSSSILSRIQEIFEENDLAISIQDTFPKNFTNHKLIGVVFPIQKGFETAEYRVFSDQEILGKNYFGSKQRRKANYNFWGKGFDLSKDDIIVHEDHGVGKFSHLEKITVNGLTHEFIKLTYAQDSRLYVPIEYFDLITLYGSNDKDIALDSLGSKHFKKRKARVKKRIGDVAKKLMELAAKRKEQMVDPVLFDLEKYEIFCQKFPYVLTEDQERAMEDIQRDLNSGYLMDRLICADPGFGKTEIALRAAYMLLASGKQVVILTPTTTLCQQHYHLCKERFSEFSVAQVSRFVSSKDLKKAHEDIETGKANLIIGTHGVLSSKVKFANLGLLVIDEEHHFGVMQKDKIKKEYQDIHILSLSATPIPRTLQMSLAGIKEMSLISTPPINRLPIHTEIGSFDEVRFQSMVEQEIKRGGQVFFVAPRIKMLTEMEEIVREKFPKLRVLTLHGSLAPEQIEEGIARFESGLYDLILATHIIEAGLDLPRANTMIVYHADMFGLAQLYQLRGRVGRSHIQAHAYLTYPSEDGLTKDAVKRLDVMKSLTQLGVGFSIATHDMDIRGYGNLIGEEQSGHIKEVGVELYQHLLEEALKHIDQEERDLFHPQISLKVDVMIPDEYIEEPQLRLSLYKALSNIHERKQLEQYRIELEDRFGKIPEALMNLIHIVDLKILCRDAYIQKLEEVKQGFFVKFYKSPNYKKMQEFLNDPWSLKYVDISKDQGFMFKMKPQWKVLKGLCLKFKGFFDE